MQVSLLTQWVLPICLFIIMLGMGLSLTMNDFTRVFKAPKAVLLGLFGQLVLLPVCGLIIAMFLVSDPILATGIMLLAACPGGTTSNLVTYLARGDLALSISLTAFSSIFALLSIPLIVGFSIEFFLAQDTPIELNINKTISTLFLITLFPVSVGMMFRRFYLTLSLSLAEKIKHFSTVFLILLVVGIAIEQRDILAQAIVSTGPAALLLNLFSMMIGYSLARAFQLNAKQSTSITIEIGLQNSALAMLVATTILENTLMAVPAAVYSVVMYLTGGCIIAVCLRNIKRNGFQQLSVFTTKADSSNR